MLNLVASQFHPPKHFIQDSKSIKENQITVKGKTKKAYTIYKVQISEGKIELFICKARNINSTFSVSVLSLLTTFEVCLSLLVNELLQHIQRSLCHVVWFCPHLSSAFFLFFIFSILLNGGSSGQMPNFLAVMHVSMCRRKKPAFQSNKIKNTHCVSIVPQRNTSFIVLRDLLHSGRLFCFQ